MRRVNRYRCGKCPYIYDPRRGDPDGGIPPGTPFARIPESWRCPVCGASKRDFVAIEAEPASASRQVERGEARAAAPAVEVSARAALTPGAAASYPAETWTVGPLKGLR